MLVTSELAVLNTHLIIYTIFLFQSDRVDTFTCRGPIFQFDRFFKEFTAKTFDLNRDTKSTLVLTE